MVEKELKILAVLTWIPAGLLRLVLILMGLFLVPLGIKYDWPKWLWLWGNDMPNDKPDDVPNSLPAWWISRTKEPPVWGTIKWYKYIERYFHYKFPTYSWFAIRNPANNGSRFLIKDPDFDKVETYGCSVTEVLKF